MDVSNFNTDRRGRTPKEENTMATSMQTPGFGVGIAAVALFAAALLARRWSE
jgi:PGF-CTERM protein